MNKSKNCRVSVPPTPCLARKAQVEQTGEPQTRKWKASLRAEKPRIPQAQGVPKECDREHNRQNDRGYVRRYIREYIRQRVREDAR